MPKLDAAERRDRKRDREKYGMRESGGSVKTIRNIILRRAEKLAKQEEREREDDAPD